MKITSLGRFPEEEIFLSKKVRVLWHLALADPLDRSWRTKLRGALLGTCLLRHWVRTCSRIGPLALKAKDASG